MQILNTQKGGVGTLRFSPDSRSLVVYASRYLEVWNPSDGERKQLLLVGGHVSQFCFHPHRHTAFAVIGPSAWVVTHSDGTLSHLEEFCQLANRLDLSAAGRSLVLSGRFNLSLRGNRLRVYDTDGDELVKRRWEDPTDRGALHWGLAWIPGTEWFALSEWTGNSPDQKAQITLREGVTGRIIATCLRDTLPSDELVASPDGTLVAATKTTLSVWPEANLSRAPRVIHADNRKHFTALAFHPSGKYLAATSNDQTVKLYDATTWQVAKTFTWNIGKMCSVAFSPDGTLAAAGSDSGKVVVWDVDV